MICDVCFNHLEQDGTCLTCRLADRVKELEEGLKYALKELEASGLYFDHPTIKRIKGYLGR